MMTEIPAGAVTVADLYRELAGLRNDMQQAVTSLKVIEATAPVQIADHEGRIRALETAMPDNAQPRLAAVETTKAKMIGAAVATSAIVSALGTWIGLVVTRH